MDRPAETYGGWFDSGGLYASISELLQRLADVAGDSDKFERALGTILRTGSRVDPNDRVKSWVIISNHGWYESITNSQIIDPHELATIFELVVIPELLDPDAPDAPAGIARWARNAQPPMISGLLTAARRRTDTWHIVLRILEPVLAARWAAEHLATDQWDADRAPRLAAELGRGDGKRSFLRNPLRRQ